MKHFTLSEFAVSGSYPQLVTKPTGKIAEAIEALVDNVLDPIREKLGKAITVTSGYRNAKLNKAVGGASTSQHTKGEAADIITGNAQSDNMAIVNALLALKIPFDQCIMEKTTRMTSGKITACRWVHISYKKDGPNRNEILAWDGKTYRKVKVTPTYEYI